MRSHIYKHEKISSQNRTQNFKASMIHNKQNKFQIHKQCNKYQFEL